MRPRKGLSVPVITVVDEAGALIEADQRALVRYVIQDGYGADVVFAAGTTGEWDRLHNRVRQRVIQVCAEEVTKANAQLRLGRAERDVELWAGITAPSPEETLENLEVAVEAGAAAAVLAPLSIQGIDDQYGTMQQLDRIAAGVRSPCRLLKLADCGHSPQRDQPQAVIEAIETQYRQSCGPTI